MIPKKLFYLLVLTGCLLLPGAARAQLNGTFKTVRFGQGSPLIGMDTVELNTQPTIYPIGTLIREINSDTLYYKFPDGFWHPLGGSGIAPPLTGSLTTPRIPYAASASTLTDSPNLYWENAQNAIVIGGSLLADGAAIYQRNNNSYFFGHDAGNFVFTGIENIGIGRSSLKQLTTGSNNTSVGTGAASVITSGSDNTALGKGANGFVSQTGLQNTTIGSEAFALGDGARNSALGYRALFNNTGNDNTGLGNRAGFSLTTGINNTLLGSFSADSITTGSGNIIIGYDVSPNIITSNNQLNIQGAIWGVNNSASGRSLSTGNIGIFKRVPTSNFDVVGTTLFTSSNFAVNSVSGLNHSNISVIPTVLRLENGVDNQILMNASGTTITTGALDLDVSAGVIDVASGGNINISTTTDINLSPTDDLNLNPTDEFFLRGFPATDPTNEFFRGDGTWAIPAGGPAGSNTQVQFNNSGVFGANSGFTWGQVANTLRVPNQIIDTQLTLSAFTATEVLFIGGSGVVQGESNFTYIQSTSTPILRVTGTAAPNIESRVDSNNRGVLSPTSVTFVKGGSSTASINVNASDNTTLDVRGSSIIFFKDAGGEIIINNNNLRTTCVGAPSGALANIAGVLNVCP